MASIPNNPAGHNVPITRARARFLRASFLYFQSLPAELRVKIWNEALPCHGVFPVRCEINHWRFRTRYEGQSILSLEPPWKTLWSSGVSKRIRTIRGLLMACQESRHEAKQRFPDVVSVWRGKMRFHGKKDLIYIPRDELIDRLLERHSSPSNPPTVLAFADGWNFIVRRLAIESSTICSTFGSLFQPVTQQSHIHAAPIINRFMIFLTKFVFLELLVLDVPGHIGSRQWNRLNASTRKDLQDALKKVYGIGIKWDRPLEKPIKKADLTRALLTEAPMCLTSIIHSNPVVIRNAYGMMPQVITIPPRFLIRFGYQGLRHLQVFGIVHLDRELMAKDMCRKTGKIDLPLSYTRDLVQLCAIQEE